MKYEITSKKKNPLMKRDEVMVSIDHSRKPTPDRKEVMAEAAKLIKTKPENLIVTKITTSGGSTKSVAKVYAYSKKEDIPDWKVKKFTERISKIKGAKPPEPAPPEESKPAEGEDKPAGDAPKEQAPPEDSESKTPQPEESAKEETSEKESEEEKKKD